jgi:hypothetical protein
MHRVRNVKFTTDLEEYIATIFRAEDGGSMFIQNCSKLLQDYTVLHREIQQSSINSSLRDEQIFNLQQNNIFRK